METTKYVPVDVMFYYMFKMVNAIKETVPDEHRLKCYKYFIESFSELISNCYNEYGMFSYEKLTKFNDDTVNYFKEEGYLKNDK